MSSTPGERPGEVCVEGEVERITFERESSGFRVVKIAVSGRRDRLAVVGTFPPVAVGTRLRVRGKLVMDAKHGEQLAAASVTEIAPSTLEGVQRYLASGAIKGVGETYAARIVEAFGLDTLRVLDEEPQRLAQVPGFGKQRVKTIGDAWKAQRALREVMIFLQAHGASASLAARLYRRYGAATVAQVTRDPYRMSLDVWGVGFKTADRIAAGLGIARDSPQRMQAGLIQVLRDERDAGHTFAEEEALLEQARALLQMGQAEAEERAGLAHALLALTAGGYVVPDAATVGTAAPRRVFPSDLHAMEERLAGRIVALASRSRDTVKGRRSPVLAGAPEALATYERDANVQLAPAQRKAVEEAAASPFLVVTGGPGVGKTTIVRAILALFDRAGLTVKLAAPTGRAAKRMSEATGREASTLHRLLEYEMRGRAGNPGGWTRNAERPVESDALVVDEASMLDLEMADALLAAVPSGGRLVLVGDVDQLASVGPGAVLRDVIASGVVPCVRLTQIFRQARESLIVTNAHRIQAGEMPEAPPPARTRGDTSADFFVIERRDPDAARKTVVDLVQSHIPRRFGLDPVRDVQVLTPMHRGGAGAQALNEALQAALNPSSTSSPSGETNPRIHRDAAVTPGAPVASVAHRGGETDPEASVAHRDRSFRVGDKVMQLRNDYERNVWNGDVGFVASVNAEEQELTVGFDDRVVAYDRAALDELTLAYACTVHKSQGSEYPAVVVVLLTSHFVMLSRQLLYTAVTRGKRLVVLVCDPRAVSLSVAEARRDERRTGLAARLVRAAGTIAV